MIQYTPLTEEELSKLAELTELKERQDKYENEMKKREIKLENDRFNSKCKSVFGLSKRQIVDRLNEKAEDNPSSYLSEYLELKSLINRLRIAWHKDEGWSFEDFVFRQEHKVNDITL